MNEKRYYWLKLEENYFDLKVQKALRKLPSGAEMLICYLKMQLRYLNKGGLIEYNGLCQDIAEEIALDIDEDVDLVKMTIALLIKWNVIEQDVDNLFLIEMQDRIGSKTDSARRVAKYREKQKMLHCNNDVTKCNSIKDIDIDIEIDNTTSTNNNIYESFEENFCRTLTSIEFEKINLWLEKYGIEKVKKALEVSVINGVRNFRYIETILINWQDKTLEEIEQSLKKPKNEKKEIFNYDWLNDEED